MPGSQILQELSLHLQTLLFDGLKLAGVVLTKKDDVSLLSPAQVADLDPGNAKSIKLSLFPFLVQANGQLNNERFIRIGNTQYAPPFYVDISYLVTPLAASATENLTILASVIDIFSTNGILRAPFLYLQLQPGGGEARLRMLQYDLENMTKLWSSLTKPYRTCVAYEVVAVPIESLRLPQSGPPVQESILDVQEMHGGI